MKMNNYLSDVMVDKFKILILYALKDMRNIQLLEKQIKINIDKYMKNKDIKYIEFLNKNMQELLRLKQTTTKYYNKINFKR